jgi:predicted dithiol-disulfide oxidoreductase (DUF899 family)
MANTKARFPGETAKYRAARNTLLKKEIAVRREIEKVAAARRKLPLGGAVPEDYVFDSANGSVTLSELFEGDRDVLCPVGSRTGQAPRRSDLARLEPARHDT